MNTEKHGSEQKLVQTNLISDPCFSVFICG
jgi:hypothetical protein